MTPNTPRVIAILALSLSLVACSNKKEEAEDATQTSLAAQTSEAKNTTASTTPAKDKEPEAPATKDPEGTKKISARMVEGPFASLDAFAKAKKGKVLHADTESATKQGDWVTEGGVIEVDGKAHHVLLAGKAGELFRVSGDADFPVDTELSKPEQYNGRAILRDKAVPPGYIAIEHIVTFVDATQSGMAHDVLGYTHMCRPHKEKLACASFTTKRGAYLVYDTSVPDYEMPNAIVKDAEGAENLVELFYMNGGEEMTAEGVYRIELP